MKIEDLEITGIKKIVVDKKAVWKKVRNRWVKYIGEQAKSGKSELEMHDYLNSMYWSFNKPTTDKKGYRRITKKYRIEVSGDTINVRRTGVNA